MEIREKDDYMWILDEEGKELGHIQFEDEGDVLVLAHTVVYPENRGQGLAEKLVLAFIEKLKRENKKVKPTCPYAAGWFEKHEEYKNYLA